VILLSLCGGLSRVNTTNMSSNNASFLGSEGVVVSLIRPILILICGMLLFNLPTLLYKLRLAFKGILYLLFCNDKTWKTPADPAKIFAQQSEDKIQTKTLYFVRHGESTWNDTFNKGKHRSALVFIVGFIPGLIKAMFYELYLLLSGKMDSWFYDAPLSHLGLQQVDVLGRFLKKAPPTSMKPDVDHMSILRNDANAPRSKLLCSSLRRAISTMAAGFRDRLARHPEERILLHPSLQEISRNPDTLSITPGHAPTVTPSWLDRTSKNICDFPFIFAHQVDTSLHVGNKPLNTNGLKRMMAFNDFVFSPSCAQEDYIVCGGHSIWFRSYFRTFLPRDVNHVSKTNKVVNCGIVALTLMKTMDSRTGKAVYMVDPKSVTVVYGGF